MKSVQQYSSNAMKGEIGCTEYEKVITVEPLQKGCQRSTSFSSGTTFLTNQSILTGLLTMSVETLFLSSSGTVLIRYMQKQIMFKTTIKFACILKGPFIDYKCS